MRLKRNSRIKATQTFHEDPNAPPIYYDGISLGGAMLSIYDANTYPPGFYLPLQGRFSAILFGGYPYPSPWTLSQIGLVASSTRSLQIEVGNLTTHFRVALGGQLLDMTPLQTFPNYTVFGADISAFAGTVTTLSLSTYTVPFEAPSRFVVDQIVFSPQPVPEPSSIVFLLSALVSAAVFRCRNRLARFARHW